MKKWKKKKKKLITVEEMIERAEAWDEKWAEVTIHSLELYDADRVDELQREFLGKKNRGAFHAVNHHSKRLWLPEVMQSFMVSRKALHGRTWDDDLRDRKVAFGFVTIVHEDWACPDTNIQFDLKKAKQKVRRALAGANFIACFEAAPYKNENWTIGNVSGKLISFHCHAIVWLGSVSGLRRLQRKLQGKFKPILEKERPVHLAHLSTIRDVEDSLLYMGKMPVLGKRTIPGKRRKTQKDSKVTFRTRRQLFHALKSHTTFDFWLGGGEGSRILRKPRNELKKKYKPVIERSLTPRRYRYRVSAI